MARPLAIRFAPNTSFSILVTILLLSSNLAPTAADADGDDPTISSFPEPDPPTAAESDDQEALSPDYYYEDPAAPSPGPSYDDYDEFEAPAPSPTDGTLYDVDVGDYAPFEALAPSPTDGTLYDDVGGDYYAAPFEAPSSTPTELLYDDVGDYHPIESPAGSFDEYDYAPFEAPAPSSTDDQLLLYEEEQDNVQDYAPLEAPTPLLGEEDYYAPFQPPAPSPTELLYDEEDNYAPMEAPVAVVSAPTAGSAFPGEDQDYLAPVGAPGPAALLYDDDDDYVGPPLQAPSPSTVGDDDYAQYDGNAPVPVPTDQQWSKAEKVAGVGVGVLGSACLLGIGAFVYYEKRKNGDDKYWSRQRWSDYESLYKKNESSSMSRKQEVELPMLDHHVRI